VPTDTTPNAFSFSAQTDVELNTSISSNAINVSGINAATSISISGADGEYSIDGGSFTNATGTISNGQSVVVRLTSANDFSTTTETTLSIGGVSAVFSVTTRAPDTTPDAFTFTDQNDVEKETLVTSNAISVSGIEVPVEISISGADGEYSIDGGSFTSASGTIANGQSVVVRVTSSSEFSTATETTLTIGGVNDTFTVTTRAVDTTPDAFSFTEVEGAALNTVITSEFVTIQGIEAPAPISISGANAEYQIQGGAFTSVAGTIENGQSVRVRMASGSAPATTQTATLTIGDFSAEFVVTTTRWEVAQIIDNNPIDARNPKVVADNNGNAIAVWLASNGAVDSVWSNRYDASSGNWGTPVLIEQDDSDSAEDPQIAMDGAGNAIVVWTQGDGTRNNVWFNRFFAGINAWGTAELLETDDSGNAQHPKMAMGANGNAIVVWEQNDNIVSRKFDASTESWDSLKQLESGSGRSRNPEVAIDGNGDAMAIWKQSDGLGDSLVASRYHKISDSWEVPTVIGVNASSWKLAVDTDGNAMVIMLSSNDLWDVLFSRRYDVASNSWLDIEQLSSGFGYSDFFELIIDHNGVSTVVLNEESFDYDFNYIKSRQFNPDTGSWTDGFYFNLFGTSILWSSVAMAVDNNNNLLLVWSESAIGSKSSIKSMFYDANDNTWSSPVLIEQNELGGARNPSVAFDGNNNAIVVWEQSDGTYFDIWSTRYIGQ
jgi:hypothetical protein